MNYELLVDSITVRMMSWMWNTGIKIYLMTENYICICIVNKLWAARIGYVYIYIYITCSIHWLVGGRQKRSGKMAETGCKATKATSNGVFQGDNPLDYAVPLAILQICLVLVVTRSLAYLLKPLRQPRVVAEVIVRFLSFVFILKSSFFTLSLSLSEGFLY